MDAQRLELYDLLKPKLDEEPARRLVLALSPHPDELVTKDYLRAELATLADKLTWQMITILGAWTVTVATLFTFLSGLLRP